MHLISRRRVAQTPSPELVGAGMSLRADLTTAEVVGALRGRGIRAILLRGPAIAHWLYGDEPRPYGDADLLVAHENLGPADAVLAELGFSDRTVAGRLAADRPTHAHSWVRERDSACLDLHWTLVGIGRPPEEAWRALTGPGTESVTVARIAVDMLAEPARALVVALHAAQHGALVEKPLADLSRALGRVPDQSWRAAATLAETLEATSAFSAGLRLLPDGRELADRLGLSAELSTETALWAATAPPTALGFDWIARTPGIRARLGLARRKVAPHAGFMRAWSPLARRGRLGLATSYVWRAVWLAWHAPAGFRAWRSARRSDRG
jgi:hypothetical protein